jgi:dTDP-glucose 4,6-dehydratase
MTRALITGMCGFIGHHVAEHFLRETDWELVGLDRIDGTSTLHRLRYIDGWGSGIEQRIKFVWHDLRSPINEYVAAQLGRVDICLHLAASTHVDRSIDDPLGFVMDNVVGTCNLLNWWRWPDINRGMFVQFGTDEVFGPAPPGVSYTEHARFNSGNPYAASKAGAEELACAFSNTYRLKVAATHTMNVIGERQHHEKFLPLVTRKVLLGEKVFIHANADRTQAGTRFYLHAANVGPALHWIIRNQEQRFDKWNIVGECEVDNLALAKMIAEVVGRPLKHELVDFHSERPGHDLRYALDGTKLRDGNFEYPLNLKQSIERTVKWYLQNKEWLGL